MDLFFLFHLLSEINGIKNLNNIIFPSLVINGVVSVQQPVIKLIGITV